MESSMGYGLWVLNSNIIFKIHVNKSPPLHVNVSSILVHPVSLLPFYTHHLTAPPNLSFSYMVGPFSMGSSTCTMFDTLTVPHYDLCNLHAPKRKKELDRWLLWFPLLHQILMTQRLPLTATGQQHD